MKPEWQVAMLAVACPGCGTLWLRTVAWDARWDAVARTSCCGAIPRDLPEPLRVESGAAR